jgi:NTP pyrophosphatase (non-canonical NTP hydrolase)
MNADEMKEHQRRLEMELALAAFTLRMHTKLTANMHKGGRANWQQTQVHDLFSRLDEEVAELQEAKWSPERVHNFAKYAEAIANECADVANFAMMISDWYLETAKQIQKQNESTS